MLLQQTARYAKDYGWDTTEEERKAIDALLDYSTLAERYRFNHADYVKSNAWGKDDKAYADWFSAWLSQGLRHPRAYFDATASMVSGWFAFPRYAPIYNSDFLDSGDAFSGKLVPHSMIERPTFFDWSSNWLEKVSKALYRIPIISLLYSVGLYASVIPFFVISMLCGQRNKRYLLVLAPLILSLVFGMWLAPTSLGANGSRYMQPLLYVAPLLIAWCALALRKDNASCP